MFKVAVHFCTQKYLTRRALGRFDGEVIRVKGIIVTILKRPYDEAQHAQYM